MGDIVEHEPPSDDLCLPRVGRRLVVLASGSPIALDPCEDAGCEVCAWVSAWREMAASEGPVTGGPGEAKQQGDEFSSSPVDLSSAGGATGEPTPAKTTETAPEARGPGEVPPRVAQDDVDRTRHSSKSADPTDEPTPPVPRSSTDTPESQVQME